MSVPASADEGNSGHADKAITVTLSQTHTSDIGYRLCFGTSGDGAMRGATGDWALWSEDFQATNAAPCPAISISAGSLSHDALRLRIYGDTVDEPDGTITVMLSETSFLPLPTGWTLGTSTATYTIRDDDPTVVTLARAAGSTGALMEGSAKTAEIVVSLGRALVVGEHIEVPLVFTGDASGTVEVATLELAVTDDTDQYSVSAAGNGVSHTRSGAKMTLTFTGSDTLDVQEAVVTFTPPHKPRFQNWDGTLTVSVDAAKSAADFLAVLGIRVPMQKRIRFVTRDSHATVGFSERSYTLAEGDGRTYTHDIPVTLSKALAYPVNVMVTATDGSAVAGTGIGEDYLDEGPWKVTVPAGDTEAYLALKVHGDRVDEDAETLTLNLKMLGVPFGVRVGTKRAVVTIRDDDTAGIDRTSLDHAVLSENGGTSRFTLELNAQPSHAVTLTYTTPNANALLLSKDGVTQAESVSFTFTPDTYPDNHYPDPVNRPPPVLTVHGVDDAVEQSQKREFEIPGQITSDDPAFRALGTPVIRVDLGDDEGTVSLEWALDTFSSHRENLGTPFSAILALSKAYGRDVTVNVALTGTATAGQDYTGAASRTVIVPAGADRWSFDLHTINDDLLEGDETVIYTIEESTFTQAHVVKDADPRLTATRIIIDDETERTVRNKDTMMDETVHATVTLAVPGEAVDGAYAFDENGAGREFTVTLSHRLDAGKRLDVPLVLTIRTASAADIAGVELKPGASLNEGVRIENATTLTPTLIFEGGAKTATVRVKAADDNTLEHTELFSLALGAQADLDADPDSTVSAKIVPAIHPMRIIDDEFTIGFSRTVENVAEDVGSARIIYRLSGTGAPSLRKDVDV